jgi:hypothetical protein
MRPRYFFVTMVSNVAFAVILTLLASCSGPPDIAHPIEPPPDVRDAQADQIAFQDDTGEPISETTETILSQATPMLDGMTLLNSNCSACHVTAWFDQIEKTRPKWEMALDRMEGMGVQLSDAERDILLDYLAVADKP